jgi:hypothetical protein
LFGKEAAEQLSTPVRLESPAVCQWWAESRIGGQIDHRAEGTGTFILCSPDYELEPGLSARCGAHGAWLEGDVEGAIRKTPVANLPTRLSEDDDLGMGCWIGFLLSTISRTGDYFTTACDDGAHRDFSARCCRLGLRQGCRHEGAIVVVKNPFRQHD